MRRFSLGLCVALGGLLAGAASANAATVYDNVPSPLDGNYPSQPFQAQQTSQFGGQIGLDGTQRQDPTITITMSSWACQSISPPSPPANTGCVTTPGAAFSHPITLNLYSVLPSGEPGGLIASVTNTFNIPFRPSTTPGCPAGSHPNGRWSTNPAAPSDANCFSGLATNITFNLAGRGITLPDRVIVALAYRTSNYGKPPMGTQPCNSTEQGCPYDSLNVGLQGPPTVGSLPRPDDAYIDATNDGSLQYCNDGGLLDVFRLSAGCWWNSAPGAGDQQPMFEVNATTPGTAGPPGTPGQTGAAGASGGTAGVVAGKKCKKKHGHKKCKKKK